MDSLEVFSNRDKRIVLQKLKTISAVLSVELSLTTTTLKVNGSEKSKIVGLKK
jgi:hypothetical protein